MTDFSLNLHQFVGPTGSLKVQEDDEVAFKLAMLIEGECRDTPSNAAKKFGFSKQRYFQLRKGFMEKGTSALRNGKRGPKTNYKRTNEVVCQVIRHRFLDPDASTDVIAQKMNQAGFDISKRSVDRIVNDYGLQKKTLQT